MPGRDESSAGGPPDKLGSEFHKKLEGQADRVIGNAFKGWWAKADDNQKTAAYVLIAAVVVGPIGLATVKPLISRTVGFNEAKAAFWLLVLTLPVAAAFAVLTGMVGRVGFPLVLILAGAVAYFGGMGMARAIVPNQLGNLYCYAAIENGELHYEKACREFKSARFDAEVRDLVGSPTRAPELLRSAYIYTADARGSLMAFCGVLAGAASGYLVRREITTT